MPVPKVGDIFRCHHCGADIHWDGVRWIVVGDTLFAFCVACVMSPDFNPQSSQGR